MCCSVLQCVAVCCSVLQCVAGWCITRMQDFVITIKNPILFHIQDFAGTHKNFQNEICRYNAENLESGIPEILECELFSHFAEYP